MNLTLLVIGAILVLASLVADYKWKQWMAKRKDERDQQR